MVVTQRAALSVAAGAALLALGLIAAIGAGATAPKGPAGEGPAAGARADTHPRACSGAHGRNLRRLGPRATRRLKSRHRRCHRRLRHRVGPEYFGTNGQFLSDRELDPAPLLRSIRRSGIREVRFGALWHTIQRSPALAGTATYEWDRLDPNVELLARHGLRLYSLLVYGARWASPQPLHPDAWKFPPRRLHYGEWADWAAALARRYGRRGTFWAQNPHLPYRPVGSYEVWNETNHGSQAFADRPEDYAALFLRARRAIKAVDPGARVVFTPHSYSRVGEWLQRAVAAEPTLADVVDVAAVHLYGRTADESLERLAGFREAVDSAFGPGVELEVTEDGTAQWPENDRVRAAYLRKLAQSVPRSGCGVSRYMVHTWWTPERERGDPEDWYGVAGSDGRLHPSGRAYVRGAQRMRGKLDRPVPGRRLGVCE